MICQTHFKTLIPFYNPWKRLKTSGFFIFLGGTERDQGDEMGKSSKKFEITH